ncbi:hypothetical protein ACFRCW_38895 [Streptomyces sp. NPDC056653]|uniref:hypothetical protein n=1 Tax=Streptomyces sp. NPDC056653 TaxID=3345894 RepID=UPI0036BA7C39
MSRLLRRLAAQDITVDELVTKEPTKLVIPHRVRTPCGKGVWHAGATASRAHDLKTYTASFQRRPMIRRPT